MNTKLKLGMIICTAAILTACGGGGGSSVNTGSNPLQKYENTYYICDQHTKTTATIHATNTNSMTLTMVEDIYQNNNCTGPIVGTYRLSQAITATYQNQTSANFPPVTIMPSSDTVDRLAVTFPGGTAQLTGSGVKGSCVNYTGGQVCYDNLSMPSTNTTGAAYLNGNYLVMFSLENGVLAADGIYSKDPSFNSNMLVAD